MTQAPSGAASAMRSGIPDQTAQAINTSPTRRGRNRLLRFALSCFPGTSESEVERDVVERGSLASPHEPSWIKRTPSSTLSIPTLPILPSGPYPPRSSLHSPRGVHVRPSPAATSVLADPHPYRTAEKAAFAGENPSWELTSSLDELRRMEFSRLDTAPGAYLDYTGAGLYPESIVAEHFQLLMSTTIGNPHSSNPTSEIASAHQAAARASLLAFFDASENIYSVILTSNASAALKLVGEAYPFSSTSALVLQCDTHNACNGVRAYAQRKGARVEYIGREVCLSLKEADVARVTPRGGSGLVVLTGQSNFTGKKLDLRLLRGCNDRGYDLFLDAAALAPTTPISLSRLDNSIGALGVSLYKMVGYPTGVGALVIRNDLLEKLKRPWFSGGTVKVVQVPGDGVLMADGYERFEDGTPNFLSFSPIPSALAFLKQHQAALALRLPLLMNYLISSLSSLTHTNGTPVVIIHFPTLPYDPASAGALLALGFQDDAGRSISDGVVELAAADVGISIRSGCVCNHGAAASLVDGLFDFAGSSLHEWIGKLLLEGMPGIVRVSLGLASNFEDAWAFVAFAKLFRGEGVHQMELKHGAKAAEQERKRLDFGFGL